MSESPNESDRSSASTNADSEPGAITDDQLPEDLQPEKNPLARDPEEVAEDQD
jgi:hypothetical protein